LKEQFELAEVGLMLWDPLTGKEERVPARKEFQQGFSISKGTDDRHTLRRAA